MLFVVFGFCCGVQAEDLSPDVVQRQQSEYQRYVLFPYLDRGFRAEQEGNLILAEQSYRRALELQPTSQEIRANLAHVLMRRGNYGGALEVLEPVMSRSDPARDKFLFLLLETFDPLDAGDISTMVSACMPGRCRGVLEGVAHRLFKSGGPELALAFLEGALEYAIGEDRVELLSLKTAYDEQANRWQRIVSDVEEIGHSRPLRDSESLRYGFALLNMRRFRTLEAFLASNQFLDVSGELALRRASIMRAVTMGEDDFARRQFKRLSKIDRLTKSEEEQYARLLVTSGDFHAARELLKEGGERGCMFLIDLALELAQKGRAKEELESCAQENRAADWLNAAINLRDEDALRKTSFNGKLEIVRLRALVDIYIGSHRHAKIIHLLESRKDQILVPDLKLALAGALEQEQRYLEAAKSYEEVLANSIDPGSRAEVFRDEKSSGDISRDRILDQASYLYMLGEKDNAAADLLERNFPFDQTQNPELLNERLLSLLHLLPPAKQKIVLQEMVDAPFSMGFAIKFGDLWRNSAACQELTELAPTLHASRHFVILARCYEVSAPGLAAYYYAVAASRGVEGIAIYQAYNYHYGGDYRAARDTWLELERGGLSDDQAFAAAISALAAEDAVLAERWWRQADIKTEQWWFTGSMIARLRGELALSAQRLNQAIAASAELNPEYLYSRAMLLREQGNIELAEADESQLAGRADVTAETQAHLAFNSGDMDREESATRLLEALRAVPEYSALREQYIYLSAAEGRSPEATAQIQQLLDQLDPDLPPVGTSSEAVNDKIYAFQRMHERLTRRHRFYVGGWSGAGGGGGGSDQLVYGSAFNSRGVQLDYDYRLVDGASTGWGALSVYGRAIVSESTDHRFSGLSHTSGVGVHWKPDLGLDVSAMAELNHRSFAQGRSGTDVMLRASTDLLSAFSAQNDWHVSVDRWFVQQFYLDGAYWVEAKDYSLFARYSAGPQFKTFLKAPSTVQPYGFLQADYLRNSLAGEISEEPVSCVSAGVGFAFNFWSGKNDYDAYRQSYSLKFEYQRYIDSNYFDGDGVFLKLEARL